ncbi:MAG: hypothetical protein ACE5H0_08315 [Bacteroidota bacterium]
MSAMDTFDWFVSTALKNPDEELKKFIDSQRQYLLTLREEDEKQRFVQEFMHEVNTLYRTKQKK